MTTEDTETARVKWADAVADANACREKLELAKDAGLDDFTIDGLQMELDAAGILAESTYQVYGEAMRTWMEDAPRRWDFVIAASTASIDDQALPAIVFGFRGGVEAPVTVTMIMPEFGWRKFQKEVDRAITQAVRQARQFRATGNGKVTS